MRPITGPRRAVHLLVAIAVTLSLGASLARANPLAPAFWACDASGRLHEVYVSIDYWAGTTNWFANPICDLPTFGSAGAGEMEVSEGTTEGIVQGTEGYPVQQSFSVFGCTPTTGPVVNGRTFTGFEVIDGVLFAVDSPAACAPSSLWTLDPATGAATLVGPTGLSSLEGLAWNPGAHVLYAVTSCPPGANATLVRIDRTSGAATPIGDTGLAGLTSLEFTMSDVVAGSDAAHGGQLYRIDAATGGATLITRSQGTEITGFAGLAATGYGYIIPTQKPSWGRMKSLYR